ncbi:site-specific integrase [Parablautia intestinalis]|uniref:Site-specific integrase n=1 Tax=Parablautia intestinalis TaxID=2320100 RepID=A0A3A9AFT4_9FIRM|nr:site-specific integrase [Parablautia intestinalis]RKI90500.1 site-specific integrase [Parablautia intestinalis]
MAKDLKGKELPAGIRQRKNGKYEGRVQYENERYSVYADSLPELKTKMTELRYRLEHGGFVAKNRMTVKEWFETWMEEYKKNQVKVGTIIAYTNYYNFYVDKYIGKRKMVDIRGEHIQRVYNGMLRDGLAVSTIKIISAVLNGCFKQAVKNGIIERNPVILATIPRQSETKARRVFSVQEQETFMKYAEESYLYNLFALAIRTGMRSGEIRGLKFSDIDRKNGVIHIVRTLKYEGGNQGFFEDTPKTKTSKRDIPLTQDMIDIIENQSKRNSQEVIFINAYIFRMDDDRPISRERLQAEINRILKKIHGAGIEFEYFTPHCFRHTFATRAIENGMKPQTLKAILGHSTLAMTMDLYSHVLPTTKAEEMELIANAF